MSKPTVSVPNKHKEILLAIGAYAQKLGTRAWLVGGAVRDFYLKKETLDIDITFEGNVEPLANLCLRNWGGTKRKFTQFGTYRVELENGLKLDLVRARKESYPHPAALPVVEPSVIKDDLFRRDFTVNAWAISLWPQDFAASFDPFGAQRDIDGGWVRILHDKSFLDDPTRLFRALRFAGRFGWKLAPETEALFKEAVAQQYPLLLTRERVSREFIKILEEKNPQPVFVLLSQYGLLDFVYPSLQWVPVMSKAHTMPQRLALLVCSLEGSGQEFLKSLRLPKELTQEIQVILDVYEMRRSPLTVLTDFQKTVLKWLFPQLPPQALEPCVIRGNDLKNQGFTGSRISAALEYCCKLQWEGKIHTAQDALARAESLPKK